MKRNALSILYMVFIYAFLIWTGTSVRASSVSGAIVPDGSEEVSSDSLAGAVISEESEEVSLDGPSGAVSPDEPEEISLDGPSEPVIQDVQEEISPSGLSEGGVPIDELHFPDEIFRGLLDASDKDRDGRLSEQEISDITILNCDSDEGEIRSLEGIGYLKDLEVLLCTDSALTSLDVSQNNKIEVLYCQGSQLESLVIGDMPDLDRLNCSDNHLTSLDLTGASRLRKLDCKRNQLEDLRLCDMEQMYSIDCRENAFTSLDLSNVAKLDHVYCGENQLLTSLKCKNIWSLQCEECQLTSLEWEEIYYLYCSKNKLSSLKTGRVTELYCNENVLTELDLSGSSLLKNLDCSKNQLRILDLTNNSETLLSVECMDNRLEDIKLGKNNCLESLYCDNNQLTSLDMENMKEVYSLSCTGNRFSVLDVSGLPSLRSVKTSPEMKVIYADTPRLVSLTRNKARARLIWEYKDKVCSMFDIYRKKGNGEWKRIKRVWRKGIYTGQYGYTDKEAGDGSVTYTVRAIRDLTDGRHAGGCEEGLTAGKALPATKGLKASPGKGKIKLTWTKVAKSSGYRIYRKTEKTEWKKIGDVKAGKTLYTDKGAKKGRTYSYRVQAYKKGIGKDKNVTVEGGYSAAKKARVS